jgi:hypothetical protein
MDRRRFLVKTLGLGAAGLAAGGVAAWAKGEFDSAAVGAASAGDLKLQLESTTAAKAALELSYSTLKKQAGDWQAQLQAANAQNAQLSTALTGAQQETANTKTQLTSVQAALEAANTRLARLQDLVGLFEQLDAVGLDGVVDNGLSAVAGAIAGVVGPSAALRSGVDSARGLLSSFEQTLPDFNAAMQWLGDQVVRLKVGLWTVETSARDTVNSALTGVAAAFSGFGGFVLDHLPFNIGKKVRGTLEATQSVLAGLTDMTNQSADQVLLKISKHVDDGPQDWKRTLVKPLREAALAPADDVLAAVSTAEGSFQTTLKDPARAALDQRRALRDQIAAFRSANGL